MHRSAVEVEELARLQRRPAAQVESMQGKQFKQSRYCGAGATNDATNFSCIDPGEQHRDLER